MNHVTLIGRLTKDPVAKHTTTGKHIANFTLAIDRYVSGKEKEVDYINCVAWEKTADVVQKYVRKGSQIAVEGRITTRNYDGTDGKKVYITEVTVSNVHLLEKAPNKEVDRNVYYPETDLDGKNDGKDDLPF